jgi:hypothetical protein
MQYGEQVVLSDAGIRMSAKQLEMIGMGPESSCWGLWLPEWSGTGESAKSGSTLPQHLVLSPFKVEMWPCLLRIVLKINDCHGSLSRAIAALVDCGINTLSHHFTPCGHHHATYTLIGVPFKAWARTVVPSSAMKIGTPDAEATAARLAVRMLAEVRWLEMELLSRNFAAWDAHRSGKCLHDESFLRMRYAFSQDPDYMFKANKPLTPEEMVRVGLAFNPASSVLKTEAEEYLKEADGIPDGNSDSRRLNRLIKSGIVADDIVKAAKGAAGKAVAIDWLQYPAFFALYGMTNGAMQFRFDASSDSLLPHAADASKYRSNLRKAVPEFLHSARAIACIDNRSNFIRVQPSRARGRPYLSVTVRHEFDPSRRRGPDGCPKEDEHNAESKDVKGSTGLLKHLSAAIRKAGGDVWHVKNIVGAMSIAAETSEIEFWLDEAPHANGEAEGCKEREKPAVPSGATATAPSSPTGIPPTQVGAREECGCENEAPLNSPLPFNERVRHCIEEKRAVIERLGVSMSVPVIRPVRSEHIFVSTKYSFWHETRKTDVRAGVEDLIHRYGYSVQCTPNDQPPHEPSIVQDVQRRITTAAGVIQILSKFDGWKTCNGASLQWLLFEAGLARGKGVPLVYAVDAKDDDEINAWKNILRIHGGEAYFLFRSEFDGKTITDSIGHGIKHLDEVIRRPRGPDVWWQ